jgi:F0F1-type ATP synthase assembly protein I
MNQIRSTSTIEAQKGSASSHERVTAWSVAGIVALAMVLPAIGMIVGGFTYHRPLLGGFGVVLMVGLGIGYFIILWRIMKINQSEPGEY